MFPMDLFVWIAGKIRSVRNLKKDYEKQALKRLQAIGIGFKTDV